MASDYIDVALRTLVRERAGDRCEYRRLSQGGQEATFHVDHIVPRNAKGPTRADNLALACVSCSLRKAARLTAADPQTGEATRLFHPRQDEWQRHFRWDDVTVVGLTVVGRATVAALRMNRDLVLSIRRQEKLLGRHPE